MSQGLNQGWVYRDRISPAAAGQTLLSYYAGRYRHSSSAEWRSRIESGQILVDGQSRSPLCRLQVGQNLTYHRPPWREPSASLNFEILYEDADLLVVHKPSGLPVMPGGGFLEHTLLRLLQRQFPQDQTPVPIHRLGRGTSGLVLLGRSALAKSELTRQMRERKITKIYRALASGSSLPDEFTVQTPIGKIPHPTLGYVFAALPNGAGGRSAQSSGRVLRRESDCSLVEVQILTGRPHQIRIHLAAVEHPLVGDPLYVAGGQARLTPDETGRWAAPGDCGYWLHALRLEFAHPRSQQHVVIESEPPGCLVYNSSTCLQQPKQL